MKHDLRTQPNLAYPHITAKVIADSISPEGKRLTTMQLTYNRYIHGEQMTHRVFSRNGESSRAVPVNVLLKQVWSNPVEPIQWFKNRGGMQATEPMSPIRAWFARRVWRLAAKSACGWSWLLLKIGLHKQWANRLLEPFQTYTAIVTSTEWENYFELRCHKDAQPEMQYLAYEVRQALLRSTPKELKKGEWHLPFVTEYEKKKYSLMECIKMSAARCARASYKNHDKSDPIPGKDFILFTRLIEAKPMHASPVEHQATPDIYLSDDDMWCKPQYHGNFVGWVQYRKLAERKIDPTSSY